MQGDSEFCGDGQKRGCGGGGAGGEEAEEAEWKQRIPCLSSSMSGFARNERWETKSERKFQSERDMRIIEWCGLIPYMLWNRLFRNTDMEFYVRELDLTGIESCFCCSFKVFNLLVELQCTMKFESLSFRWGTTNTAFDGASFISHHSSTKMRYGFDGLLISLPRWNEGTRSNIPKIVFKELGGGADMELSPTSSVPCILTDGGDLVGCDLIGIQHVNPYYWLKPPLLCMIKLLPDTCSSTDSAFEKRSWGLPDSGNDKFLIDGFPRNEENRAAFEAVTKIEPAFVLFFDCPEEEMERRILSRNQGREDDNIETIRKRFKVFLESSLPVVEYYDSKGKVRK
ncbi:hypothetical protein D5086_025610, partial [Populus alba]